MTECMENTSKCLSHSGHLVNISSFLSYNKHIQLKCILDKVLVILFKV